MPSKAPTYDPQEAVAQAHSEAWSMRRLLKLQRRIQHPNFSHPKRVDLNIADRSLFEEHLAIAQEHVAMSEKHIARQRELVRKLELHGAVSEQAKAFLAQIEALSTMYIANRDWLIQELSELE